MSSAGPSPSSLGSAAAWAALREPEHPPPRTLATAEQVAKVAYAAAPPTQRGAVLIGVTEFADPRVANLPWPLRDCQMLDERLRLFNYDAVAMVTSAQREDVHKPQAANVMRAVADMRQQVGSSGLLTVVVSTHGLVDQHGLLLLMADYDPATGQGALRVSDIAAAASPNPGDRAVLIIDCGSHWKETALSFPQLDVGAVPPLPGPRQGLAVLCSPPALPSSFCSRLCAIFDELLERKLPICPNAIFAIFQKHAAAWYPGADRRMLLVTDRAPTGGSGKLPIVDWGLAEALPNARHVTFMANVSMPALPGAAAPDMRTVGQAFRRVAPRVRVRSHPEQVQYFVLRLRGAAPSQGPGKDLGLYRQQMRQLCSERGLPAVEVKKAWFGRLFCQVPAEHFDAVRHGLTPGAPFSCSGAPEPAPSVEYLGPMFRLEVTATYKEYLLLDAVCRVQAAEPETQCRVEELGTPKPAEPPPPQPPARPAPSEPLSLRGASPGRRTVPSPHRATLAAGSVIAAPSPRQVPSPHRAPHSVPSPHGPAAHAAPSPHGLAPSVSFQPAVHSPHRAGPASAAHSAHSQPADPQREHRPQPCACPAPGAEPVSQRSHGPYSIGAEPAVSPVAVVSAAPLSDDSPVLISALPQHSQRGDSSPHHGANWAPPASAGGSYNSLWGDPGAGAAAAAPTPPPLRLAPAAQPCGTAAGDFASELLAIRRELAAEREARQQAEADLARRLEQRLDPTERRVADLHQRCLDLSAASERERSAALHAQRDAAAAAAQAERMEEELAALRRTADQLTQPSGRGVSPRSDASTRAGRGAGGGGQGAAGGGGVPMDEWLAHKDQFKLMQVQLRNIQNAVPGDGDGGSRAAALKGAARPGQVAELADAQAALATRVDAIAAEAAGAAQRQRAAEEELRQQLAEAQRLIREQQQQQQQQPESHRAPAAAEPAAPPAHNRHEIQALEEELRALRLRVEQVEAPQHWTLQHPRPCADRTNRPARDPADLSPPGKYGDPQAAHSEGLRQLRADVGELQHQVRDALSAGSNRQHYREMENLRDELLALKDSVSRLSGRLGALPTAATAAAVDAIMQKMARLEGDLAVSGSERAALAARVEALNSIVDKLLGSVGDLQEARGDGGGGDVRRTFNDMVLEDIEAQISHQGGAVIHADSHAKPVYLPQGLRSAIMALISESRQQVEAWAGGQLAAQHEQYLALNAATAEQLLHMRSAVASHDSVHSLEQQLRHLEAEMAARDEALRDRERAVLGEVNAIEQRVEAAAREVNACVASAARDFQGSLQGGLHDMRGQHGAQIAGVSEEMYSLRQELQQLRQEQQQLRQEQQGQRGNLQVLQGDIGQQGGRLQQAERAVEELYGGLGDCRSRIDHNSKTIGQSVIDLDLRLGRELGEALAKAGITDQRFTLAESRLTEEGGRIARCEARIEDVVRLVNEKSDELAQRTFQAERRVTTALDDKVAVMRQISEVAERGAAELERKWQDAEGGLKGQLRNALQQHIDSLDELLQGMRQDLQGVQERCAATEGSIGTLRTSLALSEQKRQQTDQVVEGLRTGLETLARDGTAQIMDALHARSEQLRSTLGDELDAFEQRLGDMDSQRRSADEELAAALQKIQHALTQQPSLQSVERALAELEDRRIRPALETLSQFHEMLHEVDRQLRAQSREGETLRARCDELRDALQQLQSMQSERLSAAQQDTLERLAPALREVQGRVQELEHRVQRSEQGRAAADERLKQAFANLQHEQEHVAEAARAAASAAAASERAGHGARDGDAAIAELQRRAEDLAGRVADAHRAAEMARGDSQGLREQHEGLRREVAELRQQEGQLQEQLRRELGELRSAQGAAASSQAPPPAAPDPAAEQRLAAVEGRVGEVEKKLAAAPPAGAPSPAPASGGAQQDAIQRLDAEHNEMEKVLADLRADLDELRQTVDDLDASRGEGGGEMDSEVEGRLRAIDKKLQDQSSIIASQQGALSALPGLSTNVEGHAGKIRQLEGKVEQMVDDIEALKLKA